MKTEGGYKRFRFFFGTEEDHRFARICKCKQLGGEIHFREGTRLNHGWAQESLANTITSGSDGSCSDRLWSWHTSAVMDDGET